MTGRARDGRLVHFRPEGNLDGDLRPGDVITVVVTGAAPHHLVADNLVLTHRRTRAGDSFERGVTPKTPPIGVGLGLPQVGAPAPLPAQMGCNA